MSESTDIQQEIVKIAKEKGLNPGKLTGTQYQNLSILAHKRKGDLGKSAGKAAASKIRTSLGFTVKLPVYEENKKVCRGCDKFGELNDGTIVCGACGCSGKMLESKLKDPLGACPLGLWNNDGKATVDEQPTITDGDSVSTGTAIKEIRNAP